MLDLLLITSLGFLGSFGHCLGMCGPLTAAFSLSVRSTQPSRKVSPWRQQLMFNLLLNLGRVLSYALVGAAIGTLGSVLIAGGQLAGIDSALRQGITIFTGLLLVWFGLAQINPQLLPRIPILHPLMQGHLHDRLNRLMATFSESKQWWTPALLGMIWGLIPCGFLYAAQIKAAETGSPYLGAATMLAFGIGTMPMMLGVGISTAFLSRDRRSQLFRLGGWVTLTIGLLMLLRSGDMVDYTGHTALLLLMLALIARPISRVWSAPLKYRRALGVGAFVLSWAHVAHFVDHTFNWNIQALSFLPFNQQIGMWAGIVALGLMTPAAITSFDAIAHRLGTTWRKIHLLTVPAFILVAIHMGLVGSSYLGSVGNTAHVNRVIGLGISVLIVLLARARWVWSLLSLERFYATAKK
jgi:hypothetical protein